MALFHIMYLIIFSCGVSFIWNLHIIPHFVLFSFFFPDNSSCLGGTLWGGHFGRGLLYLVGFNRGWFVCDRNIGSFLRLLFLMGNDHKGIR